MPTCPYCKQEAVLRDELPGRKSWSWSKVWVCQNYPRCDAYVGCHRGTCKPLGELANEELRNARMKAHAAFDPLWQRGGKFRGPSGRRDAYKWLAGRLGISFRKCHIALFDVETCVRVISVCFEEVGR